MVVDLWAISWQAFVGKRSPNATILLFLSNGLKPRCPIGQNHSQFLPDKYLVAKKLYLNEKYLRRKLMPRDSYRHWDSAPPDECLRVPWIYPMLCVLNTLLCVLNHKSILDRKHCFCKVLLSSSGRAMMLGQDTEAQMEPTEDLASKEKVVFFKASSLLLHPQSPEPWVHVLLSCYCLFISV